MEKEKIYRTPRAGVEYAPNSGNLLLTRCPECYRENYMLNVAYGICTWCGYNAHKDPQIINFLKRLNDE